MYCLSPPLEEVPRGDWFCPSCIASAHDAEEIGFLRGKVSITEGKIGPSNQFLSTELRSSSRERLLSGAKPDLAARALYG